MPSGPSRTFVTGFGPFLDVTENPSATIAEAVANAKGRPYRILEVSFEAVEEFLISLDPDSFDRLVLLGVADSRKQVMPELFARNYIGHAKDVRGNDRMGPIEEGGPLLIEGTLWSNELLSAEITSPDIEVSLDAGTYLCNYIYYRALRTLPGKRIGFCHVPGVAHLAVARSTELVGHLIDDVEVA